MQHETFSSYGQGGWDGDYSIASFIRTTKHRYKLFFSNREIWSEMELDFPKVLE
jgi:hypothetical protein